MTINTILRAATPLELGQFALSFACGMLTAPDTLSRSLYRVIVETVEQEREARGLCAIDWPAQARAELAYRFPPAKRKANKPALDVDLAGVEPQAIAQAAILLARGAQIAAKGGEYDVGGILGAFARALDAHVPDTPRRAGRGNAALN
jgi:hypothetical protein